MKSISENNDPVELRQVMANAKRLGNEHIYWEAIKGPVRPRQPPNPTKTYLLQALNGQYAIAEFTAAVAALSTLILA